MNKYGIDNEILNYKSLRVEKEYCRSLKLCKTFKEKIKYILYCIPRKKYKKFDNFVFNNLKLSKLYSKSDLYKSCSVYDLFITGSDQVWNLKLHRGDTSYMLDFIDDDKKKGSYAASFGYSKIPKEFEDISYRLLNKFSYLLLREQLGLNILQTLNINKNGFQVLDPTFLLKREDYNRFTTDKNREKYILFYDMIRSKNLRQFAYQLSKKLKLKIICINTDFRGYYNMKNMYLVGPDEFIDLIAKSEYVVTSSFHGIIFSMIFNKNFYFGLNKEKINNNSRIIDLANKFGFSDRNIEYISEIKDIEYNPINMKIEKERKKSIDLLMGMINDRERLVNESESNT